jgi:hypothetical protein
MGQASHLSDRALMSRKVSSGRPACLMASRQSVKFLQVRTGGGIPVDATNLNTIAQAIQTTLRLGVAESSTADSPQFEHRTGSPYGPRRRMYLTRSSARRTLADLRHGGAMIQAPAPTAEARAPQGPTRAV